jgi:predicted metal-dependent phosphoesterase TrpH
LTNYDANIKADLHTHTHYSDGVHSPEELILKVKEAGISCLAITDHDNVDSIEEAIELGKEHGVDIIPGAEISSDHKEKETHILAYFIDYKNEELLEHLKNVRRERMMRAEKIVKRLNEMEIPVQLSQVLKHVKGNASIGRPHIAIALVENNFIDNYYEVFNNYIGDDKPAYVKKPNISSFEAIKLINRSGGLSFIAHPGKNMRDSSSLFELIEGGVDGIEVVHPSHNEFDIDYFRNIASQYFLLESGGSDFHGGKINDASLLGRYFIGGNKITAMKNRLFVS